MPVLALGSCVEPDTGLWSQDARSRPRLPSCLSVSPAADLGTVSPATHWPWEGSARASSPAGEDCWAPRSTDMAAQGALWP